MPGFARKSGVRHPRAPGRTGCSGWRDGGLEGRRVGGSEGRRVTCRYVSHGLEGYVPHGLEGCGVAGLRGCGVANAALVFADGVLENLDEAAVPGAACRANTIIRRSGGGTRRGESRGGGEE